MKQFRPRQFNMSDAAVKEMLPHLIFGFHSVTTFGRTSHWLLWAFLHMLRDSESTNKTNIINSCTKTMGKKGCHLHLLLNGGEWTQELENGLIRYIG